MQNLKVRFLVLTIPVICFLMLGGFIIMNFVVERVIDDLGRSFAEDKVRYNRARSIHPLMQEIALARRLANAPGIIEWARNENDPVTKARGLAILENYRRAFRDGSYFFVIDGSGNYYFNDAEQSFTGKELRYALAPDRPKDAWYFATKKNPSECQLNVNSDPELQVTKVWINCLVRDAGKVIGIIGTGIDLTRFIQTAVKVDQAGVTNMFLDADGAIQAHPDTSEIDYRTLVKAPGQKKTIFRLIDDDTGREKFRSMIEHLKTDPDHVETAFLNLQGKRTLVGSVALDPIGWFTVTALDIGALKLGHYFVPFAFLMAIAIVLTMIVNAVVLNRIVLSRLARLGENVKKVKDGNFDIGTQEAGRDEIGRLNSSFTEMAEKIRDYTQGLELKVRDRTRDLLRAKEQAEKANQEKSQFLSSMSHEIRTPLTAVLGFGQLLQLDKMNKLSPKQKEWVAAIEESGNHLHDLVSQVLDLAKIEAGEASLTMEPLKISDVLREIEATAYALAQTEKLTLSFDKDTDAVIMADKIRLKQIMLNLISNAVKYNKENGTIDVYCETHYGIVHINVRDTGQGIPQELHQNIFDPFNRVEAENFMIEGTGIGLTITKSLAEMMNGKIGFESTPGKGSTFWICFPERR